MPNVMRTNDTKHGTDDRNPSKYYGENKRYKIPHIQSVIYACNTSKKLEYTTS